MNKDKIFSVLRILLAIGGAILVGKNFHGTVIDKNWIEVSGGIIMGLASLGWSFYDQTNTYERFQAIIMQTFLFIGGFFVSAGKISDAKLQEWGAILIMILGLVYPILSRAKSQNVAAGKVPIEALKGVNENGAPEKPITPVLNMEPPK